MRPEIENTPLPVWMKNTPRDSRGYPIPYIVEYDNDGKPQFTVNSEQKRQHVLKKDLCGICGRKLLKWRTLVGGPVSAFFETGSFIDPPMHIECAQYALQVCPYLAMPSWTKSLSKSIVKKANFKNAIMVDNTMMEGRPKLLCLVVHTKADYIYFNNRKPIIQYIKPRTPFVRVEFWQQGKMLPHAEGETLAKQVMQESLEQEYSERIEKQNKETIEALIEASIKGVRVIIQPPR